MVYPTQELPFDKLTTVDEKVDFLHKQLTDFQGQIVTSQLSLNKLLETGEPTMAKRQKQFIFKHTLDPLSGLTDHERLPMLKTVRTITIHFPDGCNALVDVAVGFSRDKRLLPAGGYLSLNDATPTWVINKEITDTDTLWVEIRNSDAVNTHAISVMVNYEEYEEVEA